MTAAAWTDWSPYAGWDPSAEILAETLDGGQSFAWYQSASEVWTGRWLNHLAQLRLQYWKPVHTC